MRETLLIRTNILLAFLLLTGFFSDIAAQTFDDARKYAFNGEREKARSICREILSQGFNSDVALLMGRTYAWDEKYDSARVVFNELLLYEPDNVEVLGAFADVEYWSENYTEAVKYCDFYLEEKPDDEDMVLKKATILNGQENTELAVKTLENFVGEYPYSSGIIKKLKEYRLDLMKNKIRILNTVDFFDSEFNRDPWNITSLSYARKMKLGTVISRLNWSNRYEKNGFQYELDAYPIINENNYGYLNYGFSNSILFPHNRLGLELYHNFPRSFEGSVGMRVLFYDKTSTDIYTATLGKYLGKYWLSARAYVTPSENENSVSGMLTMRRYFSDPENYLGLQLGYGVTPDDNFYRRLSLKRRSLRFDFNHIFNRIWILNTGVTWGAEMKEPDNYLGYYSFEISIARLF